MSVAEGEIKRSRGHPASGSDAVVTGGERAGNGGVSAKRASEARDREPLVLDSAEAGFSVLPSGDFGDLLAIQIPSTNHANHRQ